MTFMVWTLAVTPGALLVIGLIVLALQLVIIGLLLWEHRLRRRAEAHARAALHDLAHLNLRTAMGELVSAVAHEINQALTASLANAQALKRMVAANRLERGDLFPIVDDINHANLRAVDVMGRIRTLMRKEDPDIRALDLNVIVSDVVRMLNGQAAHEGVRIIADLEPDLSWVSGDRVQLRQVAMNLVLNALQAAQTHAASPSVVRVATATRERRVLLIVDDTGPGIDEGAMEKLFEPYFTTKKDGLGVGLSISRSIVVSHGGSIAVANLPQGGARFSVTLPIA
ncbi:MAG TPA: ATP-binding protein [Vicinamibacterales bacterium]|nr:ATP-binding protein [Vicinamibacterales bacterium]